MLIIDNHSSEEDGVEDGANFFLLVHQAQLADVDILILQHVYLMAGALVPFLLLNFGQIQRLPLSFLPHLLLLLLLLLRPKRGTPLPLLWLNHSSIEQLLFLQMCHRGQSIKGHHSAGFHFGQHGFGLEGIIVEASQVGDDGGEVEIFFFHFLVVAATLFGLAGADEELHSLEDLIHASHVAVDEMGIMNL